ncbi:uncharacterized protein LOC143636628 [Bidens hawaiensis]|uniref:uncharacterized protein LOC143636628 n=1 Tax=Bidens hawaiensis TaxID=980011 RepID=UPI00404B8B8C
MNTESFDVYKSSFFDLSAHQSVNKRQTSSTANCFPPYDKENVNPQTPMSYQTHIGNTFNFSSPLSDITNRGMYQSCSTTPTTFQSLSVLSNVPSSSNASVCPQNVGLRHISSVTNLLSLYDQENVNPQTPTTYQSNFAKNNNPPLHISTPLTDITNGMYQKCYTTPTPPNVPSSSKTCILRTTGSFVKARNKKKGKNTTNLSPRELHDELNDAQEIENGFKGISKDYKDHGDQSVICSACQAKLWKDESRRGNEKVGNKVYSMCCAKGKVQLPKWKEPSDNYKRLFLSSDDKSKFFLKNIRRYNSMFSFTSMGGKIDRSINKGNAPFVFRLSGQNYHSIGSLLPDTGSKPKFAQLYIYDTDNENYLESGSSSNSASNTLDLTIISELKQMLDSQNHLVKSYRMARDCIEQNPCIELKLRIIGNRQKDGRTYNLPAASEVAALIVGDIHEQLDTRDIVVKTQDGNLTPISELHPSYLPLQYPLIHVYGEDGYRIDIPHRGETLESESTNKRKTTSMRQWFCYMIQDRVNQFSIIVNGRRLNQQYLVDAYTMIESKRHFYIRNKQTILRSETYENLCKLKSKGNGDISRAGQPVMLPSSFTGGSRYMMQNYLDAMSLCKWFGYPDFFITFTCNPNWPEIKRFLRGTNLKAEDRPGISCRIFKIKLDSLMKDLKEKQPLGKVQAVVYTVEYQKRGLPNVHICIFLHPDSKLSSVEDVDPIISAEILDKDEDPELYSLVKDFMIHGPCGAYNPKCSCMIDNKCSKNFPKRFSDITCVDTDGFPIYKRPNNGRLPFHLPGKHSVVYGPDEDVDTVLDKQSISSSMFTSWMKCNQLYEEARQLNYVDFPTKFTWKQEIKRWERRKSGFSIGRIHAASPALGEAYFLRVLLNKVKGPTSFEDIRTVNGKLHETFRDACFELGLLDVDSESILKRSKKPAILVLVSM